MSQGHKTMRKSNFGKAKKGDDEKWGTMPNIMSSRSTYTKVLRDKVVLTQKYRAEVLKIAQNIPLAGHLGSRKQFY